MSKGRRSLKKCVKSGEQLTSVQTDIEDTASAKLAPVTVHTSDQTTKTHQPCTPQEQLTSVQTDIEDTASAKLAPVTVHTSDQTTKTHQPCTPQDNATHSEELLSTAQEVELYKMLRNVQLKLSRCNNRERKHLLTLKMVQNIMTNKAFMELVENKTSDGKILNLLQSRKQKRSKRSRRFTFNEIITSLSIYTQSSKAYQFLTKIFLLPESRTLDMFIKKIVIRPGVNKKMLKNLKNKAKTMSIKTRLCVLLFDEVTLQPNMNYSVLHDKINVFKKEGSSLKSASHVVVFMLKGLFEIYMQPIVYAFSSEPTKAIELKKFIQNIINQVKRAGFVVVATVCKQGTNNQEAIESLIEDTRHEKLKSGKEYRLNTFYVGKLEIIPLYDPPTLLKDLRNNLLNMPLQFEIKKGKISTAKWEHIQMLYDASLSCDRYILLPKLTDQHVVPGKINKMKVAFASQVFSHRLATYMNFNSLNGIQPPECNDTALLIRLIDELFDTMNGSPGRREIDWKPLLGPLRPPSTRCLHHKKWTEAKHVLRRMELLNENNIHVPTISKYLWNIEGLEYLSTKMAMEHGMSTIWTRRLNQDQLEKFLGPSHVMDDGITTEDQPEST